MENKVQKKQKNNSKGQNKYIPPKIKELIVLETTVLLACLKVNEGICGDGPFANS